MSESPFDNSRGTDGKMPLQSKMRFGFVIFLIMLFSYAAYQAWSFQRLARFLPLTVSLLALVVMLIGLWIDIVAYRRTGMVAGSDVPATASLAGGELKEIALEHKAKGGDVDLEELGLEELEDERIGAIEPPIKVLQRAGVVFGWMMGYIVGIAVIGLMASTTLYLIGYLRFQAKASWKIQFIGTAAILLGLTAMRILLNLEWPDYLLEDTVNSIFGW
jgi:hypothetical protein